jgi:hypothetical protein
MPTVNAIIERITSTISSMCFFIKKRTGKLINENGSYMKIIGTNPVLNNKYRKKVIKFQVHAKKKAEVTPIPDLVASVRTQVLK